MLSNTKVNDNNRSSIIQKQKPQKYVFNNTKVKTTTMDAEKYKTKNHNNEWSTTQK